MSVDAEIVLKASDRELDRNLDAAHKKLRGRMSRLGKDFAGALGNGLKTGLDLVGIGGIGSIVAAGRGVANFQKDLTRLQISSGKTKGEILSLEKQLFSVGKAKGVDPDSLLAGAAAYTSATGDLQTFVDGMDAISEATTATGAELSDLSKVAVSTSKSLGVTGKQWTEMFDVLAAQGKSKSGAVELNELSQVIGGLTPRFATFNTTGVKGVRELGALLQLARNGFNTTSEAATGLEAIMAKLVQNSKKFKAAGVNVFEKDGKTVRNLADLIYEIGESKVFKGKGGKTKMIDALGSKEAYAAILPMLSAGRSEFEKLANISSKGTIAKDFKTFMDSPAGKMQSASAAIKEAFNNSLKGNIEGVAKAMQKVADLIAWVGNHPYLAAALYAGARGGSALLSAFAGGGGGGAGGVAGVAGKVAQLAGGAGGGGAGMGMLGKAGAVGGAFATGYAIGTAFDQATGASKKLSTAMLRFAGKLDEKYERTMANAADLERRTKERTDANRRAVEMGADPSTATDTLARLQAVADQHADKANSYRDHVRAAQRPGRGWNDRLTNTKITDVPEVGNLLAQLEDKKAAELGAKARRLPGLTQDFAGAALAADPSLAGIDPMELANQAAFAANKSQSGTVDPNAALAELVGSLEKLSGNLSKPIEISVHFDDEGKLVAERLESSPHQRRH